MKTYRIPLLVVTCLFTALCVLAIVSCNQPQKNHKRTVKVYRTKAHHDPPDGGISENENDFGYVYWYILFTDNSSSSCYYTQVYSISTTPPTLNTQTSIVWSESKVNPTLEEEGVISEPDMLDDGANIPAEVEAETEASEPAEAEASSESSESGSDAGSDAGGDSGGGDSGGDGGGGGGD